MSELSDTELRVLLIIVDQTYGWIEDPLTKKRREKDWIAYSLLIKKIGRQSAAIAKALKGLRQRGLIQVLDGEGNILTNREECRGKRLYYRIQTSSESEEVGSNLFGKRSSESEVDHIYTKETNTKDNIKSKDLIQGNPDVERILKEFSDLTGYSKPTDPKPRQWAYLFVKHLGLENFTPCLRFLLTDKKYAINKLETVYRKYPVYETEALGRIATSRKFTEEDLTMQKLYKGGD